MDCVARTMRLMQYGDVTIVTQLSSMELGPPGAAAAAVYDRPIGLRLLFEDTQTGEEHYLVRYPAGLKAHVHRHSAAHTIVVLEGRLEVNGRVIGPGSYAHFAAGGAMHHQSTTEESCLFVILFHGPFDVQIVDQSPVYA
jgi:quercetin dioxygenase-like cupin family protein